MSADILDNKVFVVTVQRDRRVWAPLIGFDDLRDAQVGVQVLGLVGVRAVVRPVPSEVQRGRQ